MYVDVLGEEDAAAQKAAKCCLDDTRCFPVQRHIWIQIPVTQKMQIDRWFKNKTRGGSTYIARARFTQPARRKRSDYPHFAAWEYG